MTRSTSTSAYLGWLAQALPPRVRSEVKAGSADKLVLGYATGYEAAQIAPFVRSLRAVFDGDAALIVDDRPDVRDLLQQHRVEAIFPRPSDGWTPHAVLARFPAFLDVLNRFDHARHVLLTDVRDVVFQGDPFEPAPAGLEVFVEFEGATLGDHAFNMKYLKAAVGAEMASRVADKPCICVGTVLGPRADIERFCHVVLMLAAIPRSETGGTFGMDQAACNLVVHLNLVAAEVKPNYGRVATLGMTPGAALSFRDGRVINPGGGFSPIVHQHDRHRELDQAVHARWGSGLVHHKRVQPKSAGDRLRKLRQSVMRRLPELR